MRRYRALADHPVALPLLIFAVAFAVRLWYLAGLRHSPLFLSPIMDAEYHDQWARRLAAGDWVGQEVFFRAPLYPYFLGVLYALFGPSQVAVRVVQFALGSLTCVLLYLTGVRVGGRAVGVLAGAMAALYGPLIYFDGELLLPVLEAFFAVALLLCLAHGLARYVRPSSGEGSPESPSSDRRARFRVWPWALAGLSCGLFAITRPNILAFFPVLLLYLLWRMKWRRGLAAGGLLLAGVVVCVAPVTVRNYLVGHDLVLISSQAGVNFYIGNNPQSDGYTAVVPGTRATWWGGYRDTINIAEQAARRRLRPSEVSAYWFRQAWNFIRSQPGAWLRLTLRKAGFFWNAFELGNNTVIYAEAWSSPLMRALLWKVGPVCFPFGLVAPLGLVGLGLALVRRQESLYPAILFLLVYSASIIVFFICARYRIPIVPVLLLLGAYALVELGRELRQRQWRRAAPAVGGLALAGVLLNCGWCGPTAIDWAKAHTDRGGSYYQLGRYREAEQELRQAREVQPQRIEPQIGIGLALLGQERSREAEQMFRAILKASPDRWEALVGLGDALAQQGKLERALSYYDQAIAVDPQGVEAYQRKGDCLRKLGREQEAAATYAQGFTGMPGDELARLALANLAFDQGDFARAAQLCEGLLREGHASVQVRMVLASADLNLGQFAEADEQARRILQQDPNNAVALAVRGGCLSHAGQVRPALAAYQRAVQANPSLVEAWVGLAFCYSLPPPDYPRALQAAGKAVQLDPTSRQARFVRAGCYYDLGRRQEAAEECRLLLRYHPDFEPAREMLAQCEKQKAKRPTGRP